MLLHSWLQKIGACSRQKFPQSHRRRQTQKPNQHSSAAVEHLETRTLLAAFTWSTDSDGAWEDPANWTGDGGIPGSDDTVTIDRGAANPTITISSNAVVTSLVTTENIVLASGRLQASTSIEINGGELRWEAGTLQANNTTGVTLSNDATLRLAGAEAKTLSGVLFNHGTVAVSGAGVVGGGRVENESSGVWDFQADTNFSSTTGTTFNNRGLLRKSGGTGESRLGNNSVTRVNHFGGTVEVQSGTLSLAAAGTGLNSNANTGATFVVDGGATLNLNGGSGTLYYTGTYTGMGDGRIELSAGTLDARSTGGVTFNFEPGLFHWAGGTLTTTGVTGDAFSNTGHMTWSGSASRTLLGQAFHNTGTILQTGSGQSLLNSGGVGTYLYNDAGGVFEHQGTGSIVGGSFFNNGTFRNTSSDTEISSKLNMGSGSLLEVTAGRLLLSKGGDLNTSTFNVTASGILELNQTPGAANFQIPEGAALTGTGDGRVEFARGTLDARSTGGITFNFQPGLFHWTGGTLFTDGVGGDAFSNTGHMTWSGSGSRSLLGQAFFNTGTIVQTDSGQTNFNSGGVGTYLHNDAGGVFEHQGTGSIVGGSFFNNGTLRNTSGNTEIASKVNMGNGSLLEVTSGRLLLSRGGDLGNTTFNATSSGVLELNRIPGAANFEILDGVTLTGTGDGRVEFTGGRIESASANGVLDFAEGVFHWIGGDFYRDITNIGHVVVSGAGSKGSLNLFTNLGTVVQSADTMLKSSSSGFTNAVGGMWELQDNAGLIGTAFTGGRFRNLGTLRKTGPGTSRIVDEGMTFSHQGGIVEILDGDLVARHSTSEDSTGGHFNVTAGSTFEMTGNFAGSGTYTGEGTGSLLVSGRISGSGDFLTLNFPDGFARMTLDGAAHSNIRNTGHLTLANLEGWQGFSSIINEGTILQESGVDVLFENYSVARNYGVWEFVDDATISLRTFDGLEAYFSNFGTLRKSGIGTAKILHGAGYNVPGGGTPHFNNAGTLEVLAGGLDIESKVIRQFNRSGQTLGAGNWYVGPFSTLKFHDTDGNVEPISTLLASVTLDGAASSFPNIDSLAVNGGRFEVTGGRNFTAAGVLTNGQMRVGTELLDTAPIAGGRFVGLAVENGMRITHPRNSRVNGEPVFYVQDVPGGPLRTIVQPGGPVNVSGIDITSADLDVGGTVVPAGTLLFIHGNAAPPTLYAINPLSGQVIATQALTTVGTNQSGVAYHPGRNSVFVLGNNATITEVNTSDGSTLATFPVQPAGSPFFGVSAWGGIEIDNAGRLLVVGSSQPRVRVMASDGAFQTDVDLTFSGMARQILSDISVDRTTGDVWLASENGLAFRFSAAVAGVRGTIHVGASSTVTVSDLTSEAGSRVHIGVGGRPASGEFGAVHITGTADLSGVIVSASLENGFGPVNGDQYEIITWVSREGGIQFDDLEPNFTATVNSDSVTLLAVADSVDLESIGADTIVPATAKPNESISIEFTVRNNTSTAIAGPWTDSVYLSRDSQLSADDVLLGRYSHSTGIASLGSYTQNVTATFPAVAQGAYFVLVVNDSRQQLPDSDRHNNISFSASTIRAEVESLVPGVTESGSIGNGEERYYALNLTTLGTISLSLKTDAPGQAAMLIRHGAIPNSGNSDYRTTDLRAATQELKVSDPQLGTWYVLVRGLSAAGAATPFQLKAEYREFSVDSFYPVLGGNSGSATVDVSGFDFSNETRVQLVTSAGSIVADVQPIFRDSQTLRAVFDLRGVAASDYQIRVVDGNRIATAVGAFTVTSNNVGRLVYSFIGAGRIRPGGETTAYLEYTNVGSSDVVAPLIVLTATGGRLRYLDDADETARSTLPVLAISQNRGSVIAPNETNRIPIRVISDAGDVSVNVSALREFPIQITLPPPRRTNQSGNYVVFEPITIPAPDPYRPLWDQLKTPTRPSYISDDAWDAIYANYVSGLGSDVHDYRAMLRRNADYLTNLGYKDLTIGKLNTLEFQRASNWGELVQRNYLGAMGWGMPDFTSLKLAMQPDGTITVSHSWNTDIYRGIVGTNRFVSIDPLNPAEILVTDSGWLLKQPDGVVSHFDSRGLLVRLEDAASVGASFTYDETRLVSVQFDNGAESTIEYNVFGRVSRVSQSNGAAVEYGYDSTGEYLTRITSGQVQAEIEYITTGARATLHAVRSLTLAGRDTVVYEYDDRGRLTTTSVPGGGLQTDYAYDDLTGTITEHYSDGTEYVYSLGLFGETTRINGPSGFAASVLVDGNGLLSRLTFSDGSRISSQYDDEGRVLRSTDESGDITEYGYNQDGLLSLVRDARGNSTAWLRDADNRPAMQIRQDGSEVRVEYDATGNAVRITDAQGQITAKTYDALGRLIRVDFADARFKVFQYNERDYLTLAENENGIITFTYDASDNPTRIDYPEGRFVEYTYDDFGRRLVTSDSTGLYYRNEYDSLGRLAAVFDESNLPIVAYEYDSFGRLSRILNSNGTVVLAEYDDGGRVTKYNTLDSAGTVLFRNEYTYDLRSRPVTRITNSGVWHYDYDATGQLTRVTDPIGNITEYAYDAVGNRTVVSGTETVAYAADNLNRYQSVGGNSFTYDASGNMLTKTDGVQTWSFSWSAAGQLLSVNGPDGVFAYEYDALDQLVAVTIDGQRSEWLRDPIRDSPLSRLDASGDQVASYITGLGIVAERDSTGSPAFFSGDIVGNTLGLTAANGMVLNSYEYSPFGEIWSSSETRENPLQFSGLSGGLSFGDGLVKLGERRYSDEIGRFISEDPIGFLGSDINLYRYASNGPTYRADPSGLNPEIGPNGPIGNNWKPKSQVDGEKELRLEADRIKEAQRLKAEEHARQIELMKQQDIPTVSPDADLPETRSKVDLFEGYGFDETTEEIAEEAMEKAEKKAVREAEESALKKAGKNILKKVPVVGLAATGISLLIATAEGQELSDAAVDELVDATPLGWMKTGLSIEPLAERAGQTGKDKLLQYLPDWVREADDYVNQLGPREVPGAWEFISDTIWGTPRSYDPNDISGPDGYGEPRFVTGDDLFPYLIRFENLTSAEAPAAEVFITQQLSEDLDWASFELGDFGFGYDTIDVPDGLSSWQTRIDLSASIGIWLDITAGLDMSTGIVRWEFRSIDPLTGDLPDDPLLGFLPPNMISPEGEGFVSYTIRASGTITDGSAIHAQARIVFDTNEPIDTPVYTNSIDRQRPVSAVDSIPVVTNTNDFTLTWGGSDADGAGIATYDIYVSDDGGSFFLILDDTSDTSITVRGENGHTYRFFSVATDYVGHEQPTPLEAHATTTISVLRPAITAPAATTQLMRPTIQWTPIDGVPAYDLWITNLSTGQAPVLRPLVTGSSWVPTQDLGVGSFRIWVRGRYDDNTFTAWSAQSDFVINTQATFRPIPAAQSTGYPTIEWYSVPGAARYDLWIDNLSTGQTQFIRKTDLESTSFVPEVELSLGRYRMWIRTIDAGNKFGIWSAPAYFTVLTPPTIVSPAPSTFSSAPQFAWDPVPGAIRYDLWVDSLSGGGPQYIRNSNVLETSYTPTTAMPIGNYTFWVRAVGPGGLLGHYSAGRTLNIGGKPSVLSPVGVTTDTTPIIAWTPVDGAVRYDLWINRVDVPQAQIVRQTSLTSAEFQTSLLPLGTYRVWVRAFTSEGAAGDWSNPWSFSIDTAVATAPTLLQPPVATFNTQPTFTWTALPGATHYLLYVRNLSNPQVTIQELNITGTSFTPATALATGSWRAWVRAYAGNDVLGEFSAPRDFGINSPPVLSVSTSAVPGRPSFTWTPVELAARYELLVDRLDIAINGVIHETNLTGTEYTPIQPLAAGTYRAWIRAVSGSSVTTANSTPVDFVVAEVDTDGELLLARPFDEHELRTLPHALLASAHQVTSDAPAADNPLDVSSVAIDSDAGKLSADTGNPREESAFESKLMDQVIELLMTGTS